VVARRNGDCGTIVSRVTIGLTCNRRYNDTKLSVGWCYFAAKVGWRLVKLSGSVKPAMLRLQPVLRALALILPIHTSWHYTRHPATMTGGENSAVLKVATTFSSLYNDFCLYWYANGALFLSSTANRRHLLTWTEGRTELSASATTIGPCDVHPSEKISGIRRALSDLSCVRRPAMPWFNARLPRG